MALTMFRRGGRDKPLDPKAIRAKWEKGERSTRAARHQAAVNACFLRNKQWVFWNEGQNRLEELARNPRRMRVSINRIGPSSRLTYAKLMRRALIFDVPPGSPDDAALQNSRLAEAALSQAQREQDWEGVRLDHAVCAWTAGVGGVMVEWDAYEGTPIATDEQGRTRGTGEVCVKAVSLHEMVFEPGTRKGEKALWWMHGVGLPPDEVQDMFGLSNTPKADARELAYIWRDRDQDNETTPLTMVFSYFERPHGDNPGRVIKVAGGEEVESSEWPFPFTDRLNVALAVTEPIHGQWIGHTPVTDAIPAQLLYNASWSSIGEHMIKAGNARLGIPEGSVEDPEEFSDDPGETFSYNPVNGSLGPAYVSPPQMPQWWIQQPAMLEGVLDDQLNTHAVSRGDAPPGVESGIALSILAENDDSPTGAFAKALGECWGRVASMVLKLWEGKVQESRQSTVLIDGLVPEVIQWTGGKLTGATTAVVPLDSVIPRSRAAQAAYAMQLSDRGIITDPVQLAKIADLPDQDDLLAGLDPDTYRAMMENRWITAGAAPTVQVFDDDANHIRVLRDFMRSERFAQMDEQRQAVAFEHAEAHELQAAQKAAEQVQASMLSPMASMLPTLAAKPLPAETLQEAQQLSMMTPMGPGGALTPPGAPDGSLPPPDGQPQPGPTEQGPPQEPAPTTEAELAPAPQEGQPL